MSDHYCCKRCGLRYDDCRCEPLPPPESKSVIDTKTVAVDAEALRSVLKALIGPPHHIRELQATVDIAHLMNEPHPIATLVRQYNEWLANDQKGAT